MLWNNVEDNIVSSVYVEHTSNFVINRSEGDIGNGTDNISWDNGVVGNYWSDFNGSGTYVIDENKVDHHPLTQQVNISVPVFTHPTEIPLITIAAVTTVVVLLVMAGLLVYFKKHKRKAVWSRKIYE